MATQKLMREKKMDFELQRKRPEKILCEFSIETRIDDVELSAKIKEKLCSLGILPNQETTYILEVSFDAAIYKDGNFYKFPVEWKEWQLNQLNHKKPEEKGHTIIQGVLSQQLDKISQEVDSFQIPYQRASIIGEDLGDLNRVDFCIFEDPNPQKESDTSGGKKSRRREKPIRAFSIIPHRPSLLEHAAEVIAEQIVRKVKEESIKKLEKANHTPNLVRAEEIFTALATAILEEQPQESTTPESLAVKMIAHAQIKNDWPLEIVSEGDVTPQVGKMDPDSEIDCPEYLIFTKWKRHWRLNKVLDLASAKHHILFSGYNQKNVEQVIVLYQLKPVHFNLFIEDNGEIRPISKSNTHTAKKLLLSWSDK